MQDRPAIKELIKGIYTFLETDLVPVLHEPLKFHTRVAANLLKIIERELELEPRHLLKEAERLNRLLAKAPTSRHSTEELRTEIPKLNEELCIRIGEGEADYGPWRRKVINHIKQTLIEELEIANPPMIERSQTRY
jgi:hypothetical protein